MSESMDWNDLRYVLAIHEAGTLAGAARALGVNHSTVFRRLNNCEARLGVRLFDRLESGYQPTGAGEELAVQARRMQVAADELVRRIAGQDAGLRGMVRVTAPEDLAYHFLPGYLAVFRARYPEVQVELAVGSGMLNLTRREADIALRATARPPEHLVGLRACRIPWRFYAAPGYLVDHPAPLPADQLAGHEFIGPDDSLLHIRPFAWLVGQVVEEQMPVRTNSLAAMASLAAAGLGIALLPAHQYIHGLAQLRTVPAESFQSDLWLLHHPDLRKVRRVRLLTGFLAEQMRQDRRLYAS